MLRGIRRNKVITATTKTLNAVECRDTKLAFLIGGGVV